MKLQTSAELAERIERSLEEQKQSIADQQLLALAFQAVYATNEGRIALDSILKYIDVPSYSDNALLMARFEGRREIALAIKAHINLKTEKPSQAETITQPEVKK